MLTLLRFVPAQHHPASLVITDPPAVAVAETQYQDVQAMAARVGPCVASSAGTPQACECRHPQTLGRVRDALARAEAAQPL